ncbi:hypothetical protein ZYGM_001556 [Zygosaccharomyces mellis]|uniref:CAP-Gly domain-containing protein n=1 Tax=Zygosaccharomyces mellis TaxID=42258 RepID=A0A4C2EBV2_9SACH|nr:hypothetical protein ZYGM_001556 [Zygosaccharomyces mellis]
MVAIGDRVDVNNHQGIVRYIGYTQFAEGIWYGIELDEPAGRNDGSVHNKKYFELEKEGPYGIFAKIQSIKIIDPGSQSSLQREVSRLLKENDKLRCRLQKTEAESPNDIIEFLTMETSDLNKSIDSLKSELAVFQQREDTHVKLQAVYMDMERELRYQLEELEISFQKEIDLLKNENSRLNQELAERNNPPLEVRDLQSKLKIMEQQVYENRFLKELYEVAIDATGNKEAVQFEYLSEKVLDDRIRNNFVEKQKCRFLLVALSNTAAALTDKDTKESFLKNLGDVSRWITPFLVCLIPEEKIVLTPISRFLDSNSELSTNLSLAIRCMVITFGKIIPDLLAYYMENAVNKAPMKLITELYSVCLSIQKNCEMLLDRTSNTNCTISSRVSFSVPELFETIFQDLFSQFEFEFQDNFILELTKRILQQVQSIYLIEKINEVQQKSKFEDSQTHKTTPNSITSQDDTVTRWETLLDNKEMEVKELMIKIQVFQQKLERVSNHENEFNGMKIEVNNLRQQNDYLTQEVVDLKRILEKTQRQVENEHLKAYQIGPNGGYDDLVTELFNLGKLDLISEIRDLRLLVLKYITNEDKKPADLEWLNIPQRTESTVDIQLSNRINSLGNEVFDFVNYSTSVNLESNRFKNNYMENAKFKISAINSAIRDIKAN